MRGSGRSRGIVECSLRLVGWRRGGATIDDAEHEESGGVEEERSGPLGWSSCDGRSCLDAAGEDGVPVGGRGVRSNNPHLCISMVPPLHQYGVHGSSQPRPPYHQGPSYLLGPCLPAGNSGSGGIA